MAGVEKVINNIKDHYDRKKIGAWEISQNEIAPKMQRYAKNNRPWTDRTGNARRGLTGRAKLNDDELRILLYHTMWYGVFLEKSRGGKYAILNPTVSKFKESAINRIKRYMKR